MDTEDYKLFIEWLQERYGISEESFSSMNAELCIAFNRAWMKHKLDYTE